MAIPSPSFCLPSFQIASFTSSAARATAHHEARSSRRTENRRETEEFPHRAVSAALRAVVVERRPENKHVGRRVLCFSGFSRHGRHRSGGAERRVHQTAHSAEASTHGVLFFLSFERFVIFACSRVASRRDRGHSSVPLAAQRFRRSMGPAPGWRGACDGIFRATLRGGRSSRAEHDGPSMPPAPAHVTGSVSVGRPAPQPSVRRSPCFQLSAAVFLGTRVDTLVAIATTRRAIG